MHSSLKISAALLVNLSFLCHEVFAQLPPISFESYQSQPVGPSSPDPWDSVSGTSTVTPAGEGFGGGKALKIGVDPQEEAWLRKPVSWNPAETIAFIDFRIKPAATPSGSQANFFANGTQLAFQLPPNSTAGELWVLHGNDDAVANPPGSPVPPEKWYQSAGTFTVPQNSPVATTWLRATLRHDYQRKIWDLFIDGKLAAVNLGFEGRGANLEHLEFFGSLAGDTLIDNLEANPSNMLFPDADKDGLPDAWEIANGSNPNLYDRDAIDPATGKSFLNKYLDSLWNAQSPGTPVNGATHTGGFGSIPPLTILDHHRPVGALKGSLSVGGDGSASYSIPIDIPKGTGGMEPKVSLNYSSNGGNGIAGLGWSLSGLQQIVRGGSSYYKDPVSSHHQNDKVNSAVDGVDFDYKDRFFLDGERLICVSGDHYGAPGSVYRTEMDSYARITAIGGTTSATPWVAGSVSGPVEWKVETKSGLTVYLGQTVESKVARSEGVLSWAVTRVEDSLGNYYRVNHARDTGTFAGEIRNQRVASIDYTGHANHAPYCSIAFEYETRPDKRVFFTAGVRQSFDQRLKAVSVKTGTFENHRYELDYRISQQTGRSLLEHVTKFAGGIAIPKTTFSWKTLNHNQAKWSEEGSVDIAEYGTDRDSSSQLAGMMSPVSGDPSQVHLTGVVWRAVPFSYNVTANTWIEFEYKPSAVPPTFAMIGLDDDRLTTAPSRLIKVIGSGNPPGGAAMATSLYAPGADDPPDGYDRMRVRLGTYFSGPVNHLVLVNEDTTLTNGQGESWFRNVRVFESATTPTAPSSVPPVMFNLGDEIPRMLDSAGDDLGLRIHDFTGDGRSDLMYRIFRDKTTSGDDISLSIYGQTMIRTAAGFEANAVPVGLNLVSGIRQGVTAKTWAKRVKLASIPVDINGDGRTDFSHAHNIKQINLYRTGHSHRFATWTPGSGWGNLAAYELPFTSASNINYQRFRHFEFSDLDGDSFQDLAVHLEDGNLMISGESVLSGSSNGAAWLNKVANGQGWVRNDAFKIPKPLNIPGFGDLGRRLFDANSDGLPDYIESRSTLPRDLWLNTGSGFLPQPATSPFHLPIFLTNGNGDDVGSRMLDLNGDGLTDLVKDLSFGGVDHPTSVHLNTGAGWQKVSDGGGPLNPDPWNLGDLNFTTFDKYNEDNPGKNSMVDVNADGLVDLVVAKWNQNTVYFNTGTDWWRADGGGAHASTPPENRVIPFWADPTGAQVAKVDYQMPGLIFRSALGASEGKAVGTFMDVNGDGVADFIGDMDKPLPRVWINQCGPELINAVTDGFDAELEIEYTNLNDPTPQGPANKPTYTPFSGSLPSDHVGVIHGGKVVTRLKESDGVGGYRATCRYYGDYRFDRNDEASLGFGWTEVHDEHFQAGGGYINRGYTRTETRRDYPFAGSPAVIRSYVHVTSSMAHDPDVNPGLKMVSEEVADYGQITAGISPIATNAGGIIKRPVQISSVVRKWHLDRSMAIATTPVFSGGQLIAPAGTLYVSDEGTLMSEVATSQPAGNFDKHGFLKNSTITARDGSSTSTVNVYTEVADNAPKWHLGRLTSSTVTKSAPGKATVTKSTAFTYDPVTGLLKSETVEPGHPLSVTKTYKHDPFGNVQTTDVAASGQTRRSITVFDAKGRFPIRERGVGLGTIFHAYDFDRALVFSTTDIDGRITGFQYDAFGTRLATNHPNGTRSAEITLDFSDPANPVPAVYQLPAGVLAQLAATADCPAAVVKWARVAETSGAPPAVVYFDSLGREIVKRSGIYLGSASGFADQFSVTRYDHRGRKCRASNPFLANDPAVYWTSLSYDILDRPIQTNHPDGTSDGVVLIEPEAHATNPRMRSIIRNKRNNQLKRWEDQHGRLVQSQDPSGQTTTFSHDVEGRLKEVKIGTQVQLTNTFDPKFGYKTAVSDLSAGLSTSEYNGFGEVTKTVNARLQQTTTTYDSLGRVTSVEKPEGIYTTTYRSTSPAKGQPASVSGPSGYLETYSYGSSPHDYGQVIATSKRQSAAEQTFTTTTTYNALGLVWKETDAGGAEVTHEYVGGSFKLRSSMTAPQVSLLSEIESITTTTLTADTSAGFPASPVIRTREKLPHGVLRDTDTDARNGRLLRIFTTGLGRALGNPLQDLRYHWDENGNLKIRKDAVAGKIETFKYDEDNLGLDRLTSSTIQGQSPVNYTYAPNGNLLTKGNTSLDYGTGGYRVTSAKVKGATTPNRTYAYDSAGQVTGDGKRSYTWTSFGQLATLTQTSAPALDRFAATGSYAPEIPGIAGIQLYLQSQAQATFAFDAAGSRSQQVLVRDFADTSAARVITRYLGSFEIEEHATKPVSGTGFSTTRILHRHRLGSALLTVGPDGLGGPTLTRLAVILTDHIGSTDVIVRADLDPATGNWKTATSEPKGERQSFDAWGDRRSAATWSELRPSDGANRQTSAMDYDRGFTAHEMLDDFGLIHMNGRIYDPEIGRFLSPDPYVQVPEYSQNFNRYTYVLNNPLSYTDPSGHFIVELAVAVVAVIVEVATAVAAAAVWVAQTAVWLLGQVLIPGAGWAGLTTPGLIGVKSWAALAWSGFQTANTLSNGGDFGDVLRGWGVSLVTAGISSSLLHGLEVAIAGTEGVARTALTAAHIAGHGVVGGASRAAMGGRFEDGFISAAVGAAAMDLGITDTLSGAFAGSAESELIGEVIVSAAVGGTAEAVGGGKFANGALTASYGTLYNKWGLVGAVEGALTAYVKPIGERMGAAITLAMNGRSDLYGSVPQEEFDHAAAATGAAVGLVGGNLHKLGKLRGLFRSADEVVDAANSAGASSRLAPGGGLLAHENAGGHLLARHVGQTDAQLAARLAGNPRLPAASSFATRAEAEAAVAGAFDHNAAQVANWVGGGANGRLVLNAPFSGGSVLQSGASAAAPGTGVRVVLQGNGSGGYNVLTGFPTP